MCRSARRGVINAATDAHGKLIDGSISTFDLHTSVSNGFCYGRMNLDKKTSLVQIHKPVMQVGKFYGEFPFTIEIAGLYQEVPFAKQITVEYESVFENDTLIEEIWAGDHTHPGNQPVRGSLLGE